MLQKHASAHIDKMQNNSSLALHTQAGKISAWTDTLANLYTQAALHSMTPWADRCARIPPQSDIQDCRWSHTWSPLQSHACTCTCRVVWGTAQGSESLKRRKNTVTGSSQSRISSLVTWGQSLHALRQRAVPDHRRLWRHWMELWPSSLYPLSHFITHRDPRVLL